MVKIKSVFRRKFKQLNISSNVSKHTQRYLKPIVLVGNLKPLKS
nr:MAG TPA: hypothetical protein [Caudoviricetes sp.]